MRYGSLIAGLLAGIVLSPNSSEAQYTADFQTNLISGVTSNWSGNYLVGSNRFADVLKIRFGGALSVDSGYIGYEVNASNNVVSTASSPTAGGTSVWLIRSNLFVGYSGTGNQLLIESASSVVVGSNLVGASYIGYSVSSSNNSVGVYTFSALKTTDNLYVGYSGAGNSLAISNSGEVIESNGYVGYNSSSSNNSVLVTGTGSVWSNRSVLTVGYSGSGNSLVISEGGLVHSTSLPVGGPSGYIGFNSGSSNNSVLVTGTGSVWSCQIASGLEIGRGGWANSLIISNGGQVRSGSTRMGYESSSNSILVVGTGSIWTNTGPIFFGGGGGNGGRAGNSMTIADGAQVFSQSAFIGTGFNGGTSNNSVLVTGAGSRWKSTGTITVGSTLNNNLTVAGGSVFALNLIVECNNLLQLDSGSVIITNAAGTATLTVRGKLVINGGTLQVDQFVMTDSCAQFVRTGGTLIYGVAVLDPNRDDDGDGIPNGWEQAYGLDPLNAADANVDNDGDGFTNLQEYLAGTDPTNSASAFRINSVVRTSNDVLITWITGIGKTNALQRSSGSSGSFSNNFADIFTVTNTTGTTTNYLDVGAATNVPALYYRVRVVP